MKTLQDYKQEYDKLIYKKNLTDEKEILERLKQDRYVLRYVNIPQTEEMVLVALNQNEYALQYVSANLFKSDKNDKAEKFILAVKELADKFLK